MIFLIKIANDETNINTGIFNKYLKYQNPSFLVKDFYNVNKTINETTVNNGNDALNDSGNAVNKNGIPKHEQQK